MTADVRGARGCGCQPVSAAVSAAAAGCDEEAGSQQSTVTSPASPLAANQSARETEESSGEKCAASPDTGYTARSPTTSSSPAASACRCSVGMHGKHSIAPRRSAVQSVQSGAATKPRTSKRRVGSGQVRSGQVRSGQGMRGWSPRTCEGQQTDTWPPYAAAHCCPPCILSSLRLVSLTDT